MNNLESITPVFPIFEQTIKVARKYAAVTDVDVISRVVAEKKASSQAKIMIYGVYNAGKSTLINALVGQEVASVADVPETYKVDSYQWNNFTILDTPGVDAPIEHEEVTQEQLHAADVVLFVVNPLGVSEEQKTLEALVQLLGDKKQVMLIFNCKNPLSDEDFIKLKDQTRRNIQGLASDKNLTNILKDIPIVRVNAKTALKGRLEQKQKLLEHSGYSFFENELQKFLKSIGTSEIIQSLSAEVIKFIEKAIELANQKSSSEEVRKFGEFSARITQQEINVKHALQSKLEATGQNLKQTIIQIMRRSSSDPQVDIERSVQDSIQVMNSELEQKVTELMAFCNQLVDGVIHDLEELKIKNVEMSFDSLHSAQKDSSDDGFSANMDWGKLQAELSKLSSLIKAEHIVDTLKYGKIIFPKIFEGIGIKTMEKMAERFVSKLPYVGLILSTVYTIFSDDPEEKSLAKEAKQREEAEERRVNQINDFAEKCEFDFVSAVAMVIDDLLNNGLSKIKAEIAKMQNNFAANERVLSQDLELLSSSRDQLASIMTNL